MDVKLDVKFSFTCPLALVGEAAASPGFSAAVSAFPGALDNCAPMLFAPTKKLNRSPQKTNKDPQASLLKRRALRCCLPLSYLHKGVKSSQGKLWSKIQVRVRRVFQGSTEKRWQVIRSNKIPDWCRVAVDRLQNGEMSLVANKMRSPTPKWRDEWALWAMTAPHWDSANHRPPLRQWAGFGKGVNNRFVGAFAVHQN